MTAPTHTPGPWRTGRKVHRTIYCEEAGTEGRLIGVMDRREDATLVAAAPEMLEALRAVVTYWWDPDREPGGFKEGDVEGFVRAALAKAEGREP